MMLRIALLVGLLAFAGSCTTKCETLFSKHIERDGEKYWQSTCVPEALYKAPPPAALKK